MAADYLIPLRHPEDELASRAAELRHRLARSRARLERLRSELREEGADLEQLRAARFGPPRPGARPPFGGDPPAARGPGPG